MDLFGVGGPEILVLLLMGGVILGPRRIVRLAREIGKLVRQIQEIAQDLSKELNREIALIDRDERRQRPQNGESSLSVESDGEGPLPEAYQRFREDFPEEAELEQPSGGASSDIEGSGKSNDQ